MSMPCQDGLSGTMILGGGLVIIYGSQSGVGVQVGLKF